MKLAIQGSFQTNKNSRDQGQVGSRVLALLVTVFVLACGLCLPPKRGLTSSAVPAATEDLPPYWSWLEAEQANRTQIRTSDRPVYAYSVIPGGVSTREELKQALAHDAVAAAHYSGFHAEAARPIRLEGVRQVYVSYRLGNRIYWTTKKVTLHAGETVLTDGSNFVRGRCGNRISETPLGPTAPAEPTEPVMNAPIIRRDPLDTEDLPAPPPIWTENPTPFFLAMAPPITASPATGSAPFVAPLPFVPCCGGGVSAHTPAPPPAPPILPPGPPDQPPVEPSQPPGPPPPVVPAPEPGVWAMLVVGLAGVLAIAKLRNR